MDQASHATQVHTADATALQSYCKYTAVIHIAKRGPFNEVTVSLWEKLPEHPVCGTQ